jgi:hypothetical protein
MKRTRGARLQHEIASYVREAIAKVPPLDNMALYVDEPRIYESAVGNQLWWRVPIVPRPSPERLFPLYEVMAEVQQRLRAESHDNIILFAADVDDTVAA